MSASGRRSRRRSRVRLSRVQLVCVVAGLVMVVEGGRAGAGQPASWWDVLVVAGAVALLAVALAWPKPRRRRPAAGRSILPAATRQQRKVENSVLAGGHTPWAAPRTTQDQHRMQLEMMLAAAEQQAADLGRLDELHQLWDALPTLPKQEGN